MNQPTDAAFPQSAPPPEPAVEVSFPHGPQGASIPRSSWIVLAAGMYGALTLIGALGCALLGGFEVWGPQRWLAGARESLLGGIGLSALVLAGSVLSARFLRWAKELDRFFRSLLGPLPISHIGVLAVLSGVGEEVFFRGALQQVLGWIPTSLLFGILHFPVQRGLLPWTVFATLAGLALGYLVDATGNLSGAILAHVFINAGSLWRICRWNG